MRRFIGLFIGILLVVSLGACASNPREEDVYSEYQTQTSENQQGSTSQSVEGFNSLKRDYVVYQKEYKNDKFEGELRELKILGSFGDLMLIKLEDDAKRFVEEYPDVSIRIISYVNRNDYEEVFPMLLMTKTYGDLIQRPASGFRRETNEMYYEDLMPYLKSEQELNEENYFMNILTADKTGDKLYSLCVETNPISCFMLRKNVAPELVEKFVQTDNLSYNDLLNMYFETATSARARGEKWETKFYTGFNPMEFLLWNIDSLVDFEHKKSHFTSSDFMNLMERVKNEVYYGDELVFTEDGMQWNKFDRELMYDPLEVLKEHKRVFLKAIYGTDYYQNYPFVGQFYTEPRMIPTSEGNYYAAVNNRFAISNISTNKKEAWKFLMYLISEQPFPPEYLDGDKWRNAANRWKHFNNRIVGVVPVHKKNLDSVMTLYFPISKMTYEQDYSRYPLEGTLEEHYSKIMSQVKHNFSMMTKTKADTYDLFQYRQRGILWDDMYLYLTNKQTVEQTMQNIENKVNIWLNE